MALVARGTSIPVATGERLTTKYEFGRVLENRAASILQMALGRVGGIWEAKKIAGMAEVFYAQIAPQHFCQQRLHWHMAVQQLLQASRAFVFQVADWRGEVQRRLERAQLLAMQIDSELPP